MSIVTSLADSGVGSLRAAIAASSAGDTITFDPSLAGGTITLSSPLEINQNLQIDGSNASGITLNGNDSTRIITVGGIGVELGIKDLIFRNGKAVQDDGAGGAIKTSNQSQLTVENSQFFDNTSIGEGGGAIWTGYRSVTTVLNSEFDGNQALDLNTERGGGAIAGKSEGDLTVRDSLFNNNSGTIVQQI
ncbi:right-handed parallel beta-helix repeat-containing protein [Spirulina sp. CS-785/01]|uniref:right-handed parallel beta-helix repeat-containing protein n=1 Tax=Spirulina sp. CS-785/01 TaxID=3021716 RepID=UPI00232C17CC|nr:right-handed parallel beta-helix repeat-containing protein [Spirulina sp. CS-785/01]MDB9315354.1 right-handed parallel beta-helix repeat-containing protein [Spirulina sp. CS-785/01]